jgi:NitT/TauT family transport system substrate-binding protein
MSRNTKRRRARRLASAAVLVLAALTLFGGSATSSQSAPLETINIGWLPIANGLPMDLGIQKGFFSAQGLEIKKTTLQSGNDIVLALGSNKVDLGYVGYAPAIIGRVQGIPTQVVAASDNEGTSAADNWQNIMVKGSSSIRTPADLAGKSIAVNALKGVGEVMIRAALQKSGLDANNVKLVAMPFPTMRTALANGQVDAVWCPEPFMSQILSDGGRIVMAPGPILGKFWPVGTYVALESWIKSNPSTFRKFRTAINQSLVYASNHADEIRALLPPATRNIRLAFWSPLVDRTLLLQLARYMKQFGLIDNLPNLAKLVPTYVVNGATLQAVVGPRKTIALRSKGKLVKTLGAGQYTIQASDRSKTDNFHLTGPGRVNEKTSVRRTGTAAWTLTFRKGVYTYRSDAKGSSLKGKFTVR